MPQARTGRKAFFKHRIQIEKNDTRLDGRERVPDWQYQVTLPCLIIQGAAQEGVRFKTKSETVNFQIYFKDDPGLTVQHRMRYNGTIINYLCSFKPGGVETYTLVYGEKVSAEQPSRAMDMRGFGITMEYDKYLPNAIGGMALLATCTIIPPVAIGPLALLASCDIGYMPAGIGGAALEAEATVTLV